MKRTSSFLTLSCAALVAVLSNCGSDAPVGGGTAGATGSAGDGPNGSAAGATGAAGEPVGAAGNPGGGTAGGPPVGNGIGGATGAAGVSGGGAAGRTGGADGGAAVCRDGLVCPAMGDECTTTCQNRRQMVCSCADPAGGRMRLEWNCRNVNCGGNNDGGANGGGGGNTGAAGFRFDAGLPDGIVITDGGITLPACPANTATATCTAATEPACNTACANNRQRTCLCSNNGRWTCLGARACQ